MRTVAIPGAAVKIKINGKTINSIQSIDWVIDNGVKQFYGIDSEFAQEIAMTKHSVSGNVRNVRLRFSKGLQGANVVPLIKDILAAKYNELTVIDRQTNKSLLTVDNMMVTNQSYTIPTRGVVIFSFSFVGTAGREELDDGFKMEKNLL